MSAPGNPGFSAFRLAPGAAGPDSSLWLLLELVFRTGVIFLWLLLLRMTGKRGPAQLSPLEFAIVIGLGSAAGDPMLHADVPLLHAVLALTAVVALQRGISRLMNRHHGLETFVDGSPVELLRGGVIVGGSLSEARLSQEDLFERLRPEGVEQLGQRTCELERSNAELEQFAYVASHDLQAPIRAVTSFAELIARRSSAGLDDRGRLYLGQIMESGEHMKRLVDDLLAFSRVHTARKAPVPVDSAEVFGAVRRRLLAQPGMAGASVTGGELPVVLADAAQLDQLLQNLIANGLKYRREGVPPHVHVWAEREGSFWRFGVRDNGIGIEPHYFERIFVIVQRLHGRERYEGTGIGLAVCKKIVERHGGRLWVGSTLGEGSTFFFTLPAA